MGPLFGRVEQLGYLGDGGGTGVDVAHRCAGRLVAGLGHDQLQREPQPVMHASTPIDQRAVRVVEEEDPLELPAKARS